MQIFIGLTLAGIFLYIIVALNEKIEERKAKIIAARKDLNIQRNKLVSEMDLLNKKSEEITAFIHAFFKAPDYSDIYTSYTSYESTYSKIMDNIKFMENIISNIKLIFSEMMKINRCLVDISSREDQKNSITISQNRILSQEIPNLMSLSHHLADAFKRYEEEVNQLTLSKMMLLDSYGKIDITYWNYICNGNKQATADYIANCESLLDSTKFDEIFKLNIENILSCVWYFATEKIFSASDFKKAKIVFYRIYRRNHVDIIIAELYVKKRIGGEDVLHNRIRDFLKNPNTNMLTIIASSLMWMNAYQSENMILQYMLTNSIEMTAKTQERLHSLTNGGGKIPGGFNVESSNEYLYFDVSALAWKEEEYIGLFENLAFQDKTLAYSLAIRDESKELYISQGFNLPNSSTILDKFKLVFNEEYGKTVDVSWVNCIALSGSGEEKIDGILVTSNEWKQMGIVIYIAKIGKKLNIKFYTLFMPTGSNLAEQKQQALSMFQKLSPSITMWESSLKDTMLMSVQQLINQSTYSDNKKMHESDVIISENAPIF